MTAPSVPTVCCAVEGHGEVSALPVLVRRIAAELSQSGVVVPKPHRLPRGKMLKADGLWRAVQLQADRAGENGGVLVVTDADDDAVFDGEPESPSDAKGRSAGMVSEKYREVIHQPAFSGLIDLEAARRSSPSFSALVEAVTAPVNRG